MNCIDIRLFCMLGPYLKTRWFISFQGAYPMNRLLGEKTLMEKPEVNHEQKLCVLSLWPRS